MGAKAKITEDEVLEIAERGNGNEVEEGLIVLSTGVVLRARTMPQGLLGDLLARFPDPTPPVMFIAEKGREEENPHDPTYLARVKEKQVRLAKAMSDAAILTGTEVVEVPEGVRGPDDADWLEEVRALGYEVGGARARYLAWVKFCAAVTTDDFNLIWEAVGRQSGVTERDVATAARRFRPKA